MSRHLTWTLSQLLTTLMSASMQGTSLKMLPHQTGACGVKSECCSQVDFGSELEAALAGSENSGDDSADEALLAGVPQLRAALLRRRAERDAWRAAAAEWMQGAVPQGRGEPRLCHMLPCHSVCFLKLVLSSRGSPPPQASPL